MRAALLLTLGLLACGDDEAIGLIDGGVPRDRGVDRGVATDAEPEPTRLHDATIADFGANEPRDAPATAIEAIEAFPGAARYFARNLSSGETEAHDADQPVYVGGLMRLMPVLAYARLVEQGNLGPADQVRLRAEQVRHGGTLGADDVDQEYSLDDLARRVVKDADQTAEELLVEAVGGVNGVRSIVASLDVAGLGRYAPPCEIDREFARQLDPRFAQVDCAPLSAWVHGADATGITPDPFPEAPEYDNEQFAAAWASFGPRALGSATAESLARLLARIDDGTALSLGASNHVRQLLDASLGDGGPGDMIPPDTWVGSLGASVFAGRHWMGLVRGGADRYVFVALSDGHTRPPVLAVELFTALADQSYSALVGPDGSWPPAVPARPEWVDAVMLLDAQAARDCDSATPNDYDAVQACRRAQVRDAFAPESTVGGSIFLRDAPPAVDVAWFWSRPDDQRRRYQVQFGENNWWIWTRTLRVAELGTWQFAVFANGRAVHAESFEVR